MFANGRFSLSLLHAAAAKRSPRTAAENRWVRIMSRGSSEGDGDPGPEQMGRELVTTGVALRDVHGAAQVFLSDVLVGEVRVPVRIQGDTSADCEFVARAFGQEGRHELRGGRAGVIEVSATQLHLAVVLILRSEAEPVRAFVQRVQRQVGRARVREIDIDVVEPAPNDVLIIGHEHPLGVRLVRKADRSLRGHDDGRGDAAVCERATAGRPAPTRSASGTSWVERSARWRSLRWLVIYATPIPNFSLDVI